MNDRLLRWLAGAKAAALVLALAACGGGGGGGDDGGEKPATASVSGLAVASDTSAALTDARVTTEGVDVRTDANGRFTVDGVPAGGRRVFKVEKAGYADGFLALDLSAGQRSRGEVRLVRVGASATIDAGQPGVVTMPGSTARVDLPANSLEVVGGGAPRGRVTVDLTPLNPANDPGSMPGDYTTDAGQRIESFGAVQVRLRDADGRRVNLKAGQEATLRIPLSTRSTTPEPTIPLWWFDESRGRWVQEGEASLKGSPPQQYYEGKVKHFTYWNADKVQDTIYVHGCLKYKDGKPVVPGYAESHGIDYSGSASVPTTPAGEFVVPIRRNGRATIIGRDFEGENAVATQVGPSAVDIYLPQCLVLPEGPQPPTLLQQPSSVSVEVGQFAAITVLAQGSRPLSYQWRRNGQPIAGATGDTLLLYPALMADSGARFSVVVSNRLGTVTSNEAVLTVTAAKPPVFSVQPAARTAAVGDTVEFVVALENPRGVSLQWRRNGVAIAGATGSSYRTPVLTAADDGAMFSVVATSPAGSTVSETVRLTVADSATSEKIKVLRMIQLPLYVHQAAVAPMIFAEEDTLVALDPAEVCSSGSAAVTLQSAPFPVGKPLPAKGEVSATFSNCVSDQVTHSGTVGMNYERVSLNPDAGTTSSLMQNARVRTSDGDDGWASDVTVTGGAKSSYTRTVTGAEKVDRSVITVLATTTALDGVQGVNATFPVDSTLVFEFAEPLAGGTGRTRMAYENVVFDVNGRRYEFTGELTTQIVVGGGIQGVVEVKSGGQLVGRVRGTGSGLVIEVDGTTVPFMP
ncbi:hypothetical protein [Eleftheria terrae]|uniref:hypothetical protein n=1 Tax=Eleftheria terrae TaxID=1597781 RepID=UPI00263AA7E5|nr:hypothetical protein [Eleftheria terrae]WKB53244.1 hypothetical protein N7L95_02275 [Eleftheria terrae]